MDWIGLDWIKIDGWEDGWIDDNYLSVYLSIYPSINQSIYLPGNTTAPAATMTSWPTSAPSWIIAPIVGCCCYVDNSRL
jgi:S-methylmethionine-dependent homocysteine/selenocysteine methylase